MPILVRKFANLVVEGGRLSILQFIVKAKGGEL